MVGGKYHGILFFYFCYEGNVLLMKSTYDSISINLHNTT